MSNRSNNSVHGLSHPAPFPVSSCSGSTSASTQCTCGWRWWGEEEAPVCREKSWWAGSVGTSILGWRWISLQRMCYCERNTFYQCCSADNESMRTYSEEKQLFDPLLILYVCPLTKKCSVYYFNGRFILTVRDRITTTKYRKTHFKQVIHWFAF